MVIESALNIGSLYSKKDLAKILGIYSIEDIREGKEERFHFDDFLKANIFTGILNRNSI